MAIQISDLVRAENLRDAQQKAEKLFKEIEEHLIRPGISEKELSKEVYDLGAKWYNIRQHWHKRIVRSGPNTLEPYAANPPDRIIQPDDMLVVDLGPVFEDWEADIGRTYHLGNDPDKKRMCSDLEVIWNIVRSRFLKNTMMSGEELYSIACEETEKRGWKFGAQLAGHLIGDYPHERIPKDQINLYITPGNAEPMNSIGADGQRRHWILEIYLREPGRQYGGFFEQLLSGDESYVALPASTEKDRRERMMRKTRILWGAGASLGLAIITKLLWRKYAT